MWLMHLQLALLNCWKSFNRPSPDQGNWISWPNDSPPANFSNPFTFTDRRPNRIAERPGCGVVSDFRPKRYGCGWSKEHLWHRRTMRYVFSESGEPRVIPTSAESLTSHFLPLILKPKFWVLIRGRGNTLINTWIYKKSGGGKRNPSPDGSGKI